jgi:transcriptional regulator GlxA family with amidase domain
LIDFVASQAETCRVILSVCTGSFILHSAGLLQNKKATTHFSRLDNLRNLKDVEVAEKRFVKEGKVWTSAGVSAGIDMALELVAHEAGEETAGKVQLYAEYYPAGNRYGSAHKEPRLLVILIIDMFPVDMRLPFAEINPKIWCLCL